MTRTRTQPPTPPDNPELSPREAAEYIASMLEGLHLVAKSAEMLFLAYLIDVAREEANNQKAEG
jgi:hypothetical protein